MKLVKAVAILLVPLLLTSFLTFMPVAYASKPQPFFMRSVLTSWPDGTMNDAPLVPWNPGLPAYYGVFLQFWFTGPIPHYVWQAWFDLYAADGCYLGYKNPVFTGHYNADYSDYVMIMSGATYQISNTCTGTTSPLEGKSGTMTVNFVGRITGGHFEIVGGTGDLAGIHARGDIVPFAGDPTGLTTDYIGTYHF